MITVSTKTRIFEKHLLTEGCSKTEGLENEERYEEKDIGMAAHAFAVITPAGHDERGACGGESDTAVSTESYDGCQSGGSEYPYYGM